MPKPQIKSQITSIIMSGSGLPSIERLLGRANYTDWKFAMKTYLEHEDLWDCVLGTEQDPKKNIRAKSKIILSVE